MNLVDALLREAPEKVWEDYCGFLELSVDEYMALQDRLLTEQLRLWSGCPLGQHFLRGKASADYEELRQTLPLLRGAL